MGIAIDLTTVIFFAVGLALLYALGWLLLVPFKILLRFLFNGLLGGAMLMLINLFGSPLGLRIAINPLTALMAGLLGVPGVVTILALQSIL
jgi:inhibitor of the pro-sigma K processing machinery